MEDFSWFIFLSVFVFWYQIRKLSCLARNDFLYSKVDQKYLIIILIYTLYYRSYKI